MLIKATLSNARHPEYGEVTIPFPIKTSEYDHSVMRDVRSTVKSRGDI